MRTCTSCCTIKCGRGLLKSNFLLLLCPVASYIGNNTNTLLYFSGGSSYLLIYGVIHGFINNTHCGKNSKLLICSKNSVGTYIAIRGHPSYWWINKEINFLLLLAHISCNFLKWSHDQEVAWLYIFDPKKFKNLKIYSVTSIFLRNKLSWILKWVVPEGGSNFENLM